MVSCPRGEAARSRYHHVGFRVCHRSSTDITVRALHIVVPEVLPGTGTTDVVIAEAHADILWGQRICPADKDFVRGGGRLVDPSRNFAVAGGFKMARFGATCCTSTIRRV